MTNTIVKVKGKKGDVNADKVLERNGYFVNSGWFSDSVEIEKNAKKYEYAHPVWTSKNEVRIKLKK